MTKITLRSLICCVALILGACGGGGNIPADAKDCQMTLYGFTDDGLNQKTMAFNSLDAFAIHNGGYVSSTGARLFEPQLEILDTGVGWVLVGVLAPPHVPNTNYVAGEMQILAQDIKQVGQGYKIWSCKVGSLNFGDKIMIRTSGEQGVPTEIQMNLYVPITTWGWISIPPGLTGIEYFTVPGDRLRMHLN